MIDIKLFIIDIELYHYIKLFMIDIGLSHYIKLLYYIELF